MQTDFRNKIPPLALTFPNTEGMVSVLDGMYNLKKQRQDYFFRSYISVLNPYRSHLETYLKDLGFPKLVPGIPMVVLHTLALNAGDIMNYRGSERGIKLFLQSMTLGKVTLNLDGFYPISTSIVPNDLSTGFLPDDPDNGLADDPADDAWFLYSPEEESLDSSFSAVIETYFIDNQPIKDYIASAILYFLPFFETFSTPNITYECGRIMKLENMPEYFNDLDNSPETSVIYHDAAKVLYAGGYAVNYSCFYEDIKDIYSDETTTDLPSFPITSCGAINPYTYETDDVCSDLFSASWQDALDQNFDIIDGDAFYETFTAFCGSSFGLALNDNVPAPNALDFLFSQAYSIDASSTIKTISP